MLPVPCDNPLGEVASLLVLKEQEQLVYFSVSDYILSFNLETYTWITPPHFCDICDDYFDTSSSSRPPTFCNKPVSIIADLALVFATILAAVFQKDITSVHLRLLMGPKN